MKTITFYSYKGGVGRSLALSNVANRLAEFGKKVCILDFDLEAPGLHLKFGDYISQKGVKNGIVDYIDLFMREGVVAKDIQEFVTPIDFGDNDRRVPISLLAAGDTQSHSYWSKVCSIDWKRFFYEKDSVGVDFFYNLKWQIKEQIDPDFLLIDSRTGITDISGVTMSIMADEVVLLAANNRENIEGITQIIKTLLIPENSIENKIPKINFVLTRIPFFQNPKDKPKETNAKNSALMRINQSLMDSGFGYQVNNALVIHSDPDLEIQESFKIGHKYQLDKDADRSVIGIDYLDLFEEITFGMISDKERKAFDFFMRVESLIQKAKVTQNFSERVSLLKSAIEIDPKSGNAYAALGMAFFDNQFFERALEHFLIAADLDPALEFGHKVHQGICYHQLKNYQQALKLYDELLVYIPNEPFLLNQIAKIYYVQRNYYLALDYTSRSIKHPSRVEESWNLHANTLRALGRFDEALDAIYIALEINPQSKDSTGTLAEINAEQGNYREFYKNLEQSFSFGITSERFQQILEDEESVYSKFYGSARFHAILEKYGIQIDLENISTKRRHRKI
jgi:tetratricopeptide (TPR) repeat protein